MREHWRFLVGAALLLLVAGVVIAIATDTPAEVRLRQSLGLDAPCLASTQESDGWREEPSLPAARDESRAVALGGSIYLAGGTARLLEYGRPSEVPGVREHVRAQSVDELLRFDPVVGRYERLAPMPERLNHIVLAAHGGRIYVVGGLGDLLFGADVRREMFEYDPGEDRWRRMPPMPTARGAASGAVIGDSLFVAGGMGAGGKVLDVVERFDFRTRRWERAADMPSAREHAASAVSGERMYVLGGRTLRSDSIDVVEVYDPANDRWRRATPLPQDAGSLEAASVEGFVLAIGGDDDREGWVTDAVQRYDPTSNQWTPLPPMRTKRHGMAAAIAGDRLWTFGGSPCARFAASPIVESFDLRLVSG
jgi:N-acetylneuraminic acid mutarotase